ncbi:MAG: hypothetical protein Q4B63_11270, partial [Clostridium perfringens]|nr:hypothetical protein [Clostridium perfringens]
MAKYKVIKKYNNKIKQLEEEGNIEDSLILELAKTAIWLTKCAEHYKKKIGQTDDLEAKEKYLKLVKTFYDLKLKIAKLLLKTNRVQVEFFKPKVKHKFMNLEICEKHKKALEESKTNLISFLYQNNNFREIYHCKECSYDLERMFYCIYYLTIEVDDISIKLNIPYAFLKDEKEVKKSLKEDWKVRKEGFYYKDKCIVKKDEILEDITFSKEEL